MGTEKRAHTKYNLKDRGYSMPKGSLQYALSLPASGRKVSGKSRYVRRTVNRGPQAKRDNSKRITARGLPITWTSNRVLTSKTRTQQKNHSMWTSNRVPHNRTIHTHRSLTSVFGWEPVLIPEYGRDIRKGIC